MREAPNSTGDKPLPHRERGPELNWRRTLTSLWERPLTQLETDPYLIVRGPWLNWWQTLTSSWDRPLTQLGRDPYINRRKAPTSANWLQESESITACAVHVTRPQVQRLPTFIPPNGPCTGCLAANLLLIKCPLVLVSTKSSNIAPRNISYFGTHWGVCVCVCGGGDNSFHT